MTHSRKLARVVAVLACLSLAGTVRAQRYYSYQPRVGVIPGHHFYQSGGYVTVPPIGGAFAYGRAYAGSNQGITPAAYHGSVSGFPGGYTGSVFGFPRYSPLAGQGTYPYGLYNAYTFSLYNLSGYGVSNYVSPLGSYARPYTLLPSRYAPVYQNTGYYRGPLLYEP